MSQKDLIIIMFKLNCESKSVIEPASFLLQLVLEVSNVLTISVPTIALATILSICRFHSRVE